MVIGRPPKCSVIAERCRKLRADGLTYRDIAEMTGVSYVSAWRYCRDDNFDRILKNVVMEHGSTLDRLA